MSRAFRRDQGGQTLVEFALILPVFFLIVFGLIDGGRLVFTNSTLSQGVREGARLAAAEAGWIGITRPSCIPDESSRSEIGQHVCPNDVASFKSHVVEAVNRMTVTLGPITAADVHLSCNAGDATDPAPNGDWTEASGGNGCSDGSGGAIAVSGDLVSVRVEYTYDTFTPFVTSILGSVPLSASATMMIN